MHQPFLTDLIEPKHTPAWVIWTTIICFFLALAILAVVALAYGEHRQEQDAREAALRSIADATSATVRDRDGKHAVTLTGDDATILRDMAHRVLDASSGVDSWSFNHAVVSLLFVNEDGDTTRIDFERRQQFYLAESDEWYSGEAEFAFLLQLICTTHVLESGAEPTGSVNSAIGMVGLFRTAMTYGDHRWMDSAPHERRFVQSWVDRFNAVSGEAPLQLPEPRSAR